jgi:hypothetical protein
LKSPYLVEHSDKIGFFSVFCTYHLSAQFFTYPLLTNPTCEVT